MYPPRDRRFHLGGPGVLLMLESTPQLAWEPGWPAPLRAAQRIFGLPRLSDKDLERVQAGDRQLRLAYRLARWRIAHSCALTIDNVIGNQERPLAWDTPQMQCLLC